MIATKKHVANLRTNISRSEDEQRGKLLFIASDLQSTSQVICASLANNDFDALADALGRIEAMGRNAKGWLSD